MVTLQWPLTSLANWRGRIDCEIMGKEKREGGNLVLMLQRQQEGKLEVSKGTQATRKRSQEAIGKRRKRRQKRSQASGNNMRRKRPQQWRRSMEAGRNVERDVNCTKS